MSSSREYAELKRENEALKRRLVDAEKQLASLTGANVESAAPTSSATDTTEETTDAAKAITVTGGVLPYGDLEVGVVNYITDTATSSSGSFPSGPGEITLIGYGGATFTGCTVDAVGGTLTLGAVWTYLVWDESSDAWLCKGISNF